MARFDRYFLSQLLMLFGFFSLVLVGVYWINRAVALFDQIISDGQSAGVFLQITALTLPNVIRLVLPISAFAASVYVANRMLNDSELVVAQSAGLGPFRLARAPLVFGLFVSALLLVLTHLIVPASRVELGRQQAQIAENVTSRFLVAGRFMHPASGLTVYAREIDERGELSGVFLSDDRSPDGGTIYTAARALLVRAEAGPKLVMFDGVSQRYDVRTRRLSNTRFSDFAYDLAGLTGGRRDGALDERELPTPVLLAPTPEALAATGKPADVLLYEGHARIAQPFLGLAAALIGFATLLSGGFSRFGFWRQVALAIGLLIAVQFLDNAIADRALRDARLLPLVYLPALVGIGAALGLLHWAGRRRRMPRGAAA